MLFAVLCFNEVNWGVEFTFQQKQSLNHEKNTGRECTGFPFKPRVRVIFFQGISTRRASWRVAGEEEEEDGVTRMNVYTHK